jgi:hypothetical protein
MRGYLRRYLKVEYTDFNAFLARVFRLLNAVIRRSNPASVNRPREERLLAPEALTLIADSHATDALYDYLYSVASDEQPD